MSLIKEKELSFESFRKKIVMRLEHLQSEQRLSFLISELVREIRGKDEIDVECVYLPIFVHKRSDDCIVSLNYEEERIEVPYLYDKYNDKEDKNE